QSHGIAPPAPGRTLPTPPGGPLAAGGAPSLSVEPRYSSRSSWLYLYYITSAPHLCQGRGGIFPRLPQNAFTCGKPYGAGGARGGEARLESNAPQSLAPQGVRLAKRELSHCTAVGK